MSKNTQIEFQKLRVKKMIRILRALFPNSEVTLTHKSAWELLVATILSAQCTDKKVNEVTGTLFKKYPTVADYAAAKPAQFQRDIRQTGFFKTKTKHIMAAAKIIMKKFGGVVPETMAELVALPGVGRKTANVVLGGAFGKNEGIAVDTHVQRLARALKLSKGKTPEAIERDLMKIVPPARWSDFSVWLILYGRTYAPARKRDHAGEPLRDFYV